MDHDEDRSLSLGTEISVSVPPPSPLTGCYLLAVIGEPHTEEHKEIILQRLVKGLQSWDSDEHQVDLEKELMTLTQQAPEGEDARNGERLIQFASENLVTEILIHPQMNTLMQCMRNLLSSFTRHRHLIHAGYTAAGNGSWIVQDGTFSLADFTDAYQENEVQRVIRAYENSISIDIHCSTMGGGEWANLPGMSFVKYCKLRVNPKDILDSGSQAIKDFVGYLNPYIIPASLEQLLVSSDVVGNIRFTHPTLYVFPGGQGDAALFGINGFNMLVDGGFSRKACWWDFARHLDRLDAVILTRVNNSSIAGMAAVLKRKAGASVYPHIGHFFCNLEERRVLSSPDGDKDSDPLLVSLLQEGSDMMADVRHINLKPQHCWRSPDPINLYHKVGHGSLDMYVLNPSKDSKHVRDFLKKWHGSEQKLFEGPSVSGPFNFPIPNIVSICALLVWRPANPDEHVTRLMFPGSTPQHKIFEGLEKLKHLEFLQHPKCTGRQITSTPSPVPTAVHTTVKRSTTKTTKEKLSTTEKKDEKTEKDSVIKTGKDRITADKKSDKIFDLNQTEKSKDETDSKNYIDNKLINELIDGEDKKIESVLREAITSRIETKLDSSSIENITKKQEFKKKDKIITEKKVKRTEKTEDNKEATLKLEAKKSEHENKSKVDTRKKGDIKGSSTITRTKITQKTSQKVSEKKTITTAGDKKAMLDKSPPATPKKSTEIKITKEPTPPASARLKTKVRKLSPGSTPAKSTKEANNRRVVESKYKQASPKRELTARPTEKKEIKVKREPISRRPRPLGSPVKAVKLMKSPTKAAKSIRVDPKLKGLQRVNYEDILKDAKKSDEENSKSIDDFKQDIDDKEEQEIVREIEAVFNRDSEADEKVEYVGRSDIEKITCLITDAKTEATADTEFEEEYLIIEKEEIDQYTEESALDHELQEQEEELQKHAKDSNESEKKKSVIEMASEIINDEEVMPVDIKHADSKEHSFSVEEKQDLSSEKKTSDSKNGQQKTKSIVPETQQDEKVSSQITVESGATTTAPTLPEDERITLDDIKEDNQVVEKYDNEETKEIIPPQTLGNIPKERKVRDIVKTPDEVADLPLHEEVDYQTFEEKKTPLDENKILSVRSFEKPIEIKDDDVFKRIPDVGFVHEIKVPKNLPLTDPTTSTDVHPIEDDVIVTTLQKPSHAEVVTVTPGSAPESPMYPENKEIKDMLVGKPLDTVKEYEGADYCFGFTEKLRETHITTVESPLKDNVNIVEEISCLPDKIPSIPEDVEKEMEEAKLFDGEKSPKSPKEVEKIVASVAEVLKSDKPLEELIAPKSDQVNLPVETIHISVLETTDDMKLDDSQTVRHISTDLQKSLDVKDTSPARSATPDEGSDGTEKTVLSEAKKQLEIKDESSNEILTKVEFVEELSPLDLPKDQLISVFKLETESPKSSERKLSSTFESAKTLEKLEEKMAELRKKDEDQQDTESEIVVLSEDKIKDIDFSGNDVSQIMSYKVKKKDSIDIDAIISTNSQEVPVFDLQTNEKTELVENLVTKPDLELSDIDAVVQDSFETLETEIDTKLQDKIADVAKQAVNNEYQDKNEDVVDHTETEHKLNHQEFTEIKQESSEKELEATVNETLTQTSQELSKVGSPVFDDRNDINTLKASIQMENNQIFVGHSESIEAVSPTVQQSIVIASTEEILPVSEVTKSASPITEEKAVIDAAIEAALQISQKDITATSSEELKDASPSKILDSKSEFQTVDNSQKDMSLNKANLPADVNIETVSSYTLTKADDAQFTQHTEIDILKAGTNDIFATSKETVSPSDLHIDSVEKDTPEIITEYKPTSPQQSSKPSESVSPTQDESALTDDFGTKKEVETLLRKDSLKVKETDVVESTTEATATKGAVPYTHSTTIENQEYRTNESNISVGTLRKESIQVVANLETSCESKESSRSVSPAVKRDEMEKFPEDQNLITHESHDSVSAQLMTIITDDKQTNNSVITEDRLKVETTATANNLQTVSGDKTTRKVDSKDTSRSLSPANDENFDQSSAVESVCLKQSLELNETNPEVLFDKETKVLRQDKLDILSESEEAFKFVSQTKEASPSGELIAMIEQPEDTASSDFSPKVEIPVRKVSLQVSTEEGAMADVGFKDSTESVSPVLKKESEEISSQEKLISTDQFGSDISPKIETPIRKDSPQVEIDDILMGDGGTKESSRSVSPAIKEESKEISPQEKLLGTDNFSSDISPKMDTTIRKDSLQVATEDNAKADGGSKDSSRSVSPAIKEESKEIASPQKPINQDEFGSGISPITETSIRKDSLQITTEDNAKADGGSKDSSRSVSPAIKEESIIASPQKPINQDEFGSGISPIMETSLRKDSLQITTEDNAKADGGSKDSSQSVSPAIKKESKEIASPQKRINQDEFGSGISPITETSIRKDSLQITTEDNAKADGCSKDSSRSVSPAIKKESKEIASPQKPINQDEFGSGISPIMETFLGKDSLQITTEDNAKAGGGSKDSSRSVSPAIKDESKHVSSPEKPVSTDKFESDVSPKIKTPLRKDSLKVEIDDILMGDGGTKESSRSVSPAIKEESKEISPQEKLLGTDNFSSDISPKMDTSIRKDSLQLATEDNAKADGGSKDSSRSVSPGIKDESKEISPQEKLLGADHFSSVISPKMDTSIRKDSLQITTEDNAKADGGSKDSSRSVSPAIKEESKEIASPQKPINQDKFGSGISPIMETSIRKDSLQITTEDNANADGGSKDSSRSVSPAIKEESKEIASEEKAKDTDKFGRDISPKMETPIRKDSLQLSCKEYAIADNGTKGESQSISPAIKKESEEIASPQKSISTDNFGSGISLAIETSIEKDSLQVSTEANAKTDGGSKDSSRSVSPAIKDESKVVSSQEKPVITDKFDSDVSLKIETPLRKDSQQVETEDNAMADGGTKESSRSVSPAIKEESKEISPQEKLLGTDHFSSEISPKMDTSIRNDSLQVATEDNAKPDSGSKDSSRSVSPAIKEESTKLTSQEKPVSTDKFDSDVSPKIETLLRKDNQKVAIEDKAKADGGSKDSSQSVSPATKEECIEISSQEKPIRTDKFGSDISPKIETPLREDSLQVATEDNALTDVISKDLSPLVSPAVKEESIEIASEEKPIDTDQFGTDISPKIETPIRKDSLQLSTEDNAKAGGGSKDSSRSVSPAIKDESKDVSSPEKPVSTDKFDSDFSSKIETPLRKDSLKVETEDISMADGSLKDSSRSVSPAIKEGREEIASEEKPIDTDQLGSDISPEIETPIRKDSLQIGTKDIAMADGGTKDENQSVSPAIIQESKETASPQKSISTDNFGCGISLAIETSIEKDSLYLATEDTAMANGGLKDSSGSVSPTGKEESIEISSQEKLISTPSVETSIRKDSLQVSTEANEIADGGSKDSSRSVSPAIKEGRKEIASEEKPIGTDQFGSDVSPKIETPLRKDSLQVAIDDNAKTDGGSKESSRSVNQAIKDESKDVSSQEKPVSTDKLDSDVSPKIEKPLTKDSQQVETENNVMADGGTKESSRSVSPAIKEETKEISSQEKLSSTDQFGSDISPEIKTPIRKDSPQVATKDNALADVISKDLSPLVSLTVNEESIEIASEEKLIGTDQFGSEMSPEIETPLRKDSLQVAIDDNAKTDGSSKDSSRSVSPAIKYDSKDVSSQEKPVSTDKFDSDVSPKIETPLRKDSLKVEADDIAMADGGTKESSRSVSPAIKEETKEISSQEKLLSTDHFGSDISPKMETSIRKDSLQVATEDDAKADGGSKDSIESVSPAIKEESIEKSSQEKPISTDKFDSDVSLKIETPLRKDSLHVATEDNALADVISKDSSPLVSPAVKEESIEIASEEKPIGTDQFGSDISPEIKTPIRKDSLQVATKDNALADVISKDLSPLVSLTVNEESIEIASEEKLIGTDQFGSEMSPEIETPLRKDSLQVAIDDNAKTDGSSKDSSRSVSPAIKYDSKDVSSQEKPVSTDKFDSDVSPKIETPLRKDSLKVEADDIAMADGGTKESSRSVSPAIKEETKEISSQEKLLSTDHFGSDISPKMETSIRKDSLQVATEDDAKADGGLKDSIGSVSPAIKEESIEKSSQEKPISTDKFDSDVSLKIETPLRKDSQQVATEINALADVISKDLSPSVRQAVKEESKEIASEEKPIGTDQFGSDISPEIKTPIRKDSLQVAIDDNAKTDGGSKDSSRSVSPAIVKTLTTATSEVDQEAAIARKDSLPVNSDIDTICVKVPKDFSLSVSPTIQKNALEKSLQEQPVTQDQSQKSSRAGSPVYKITVAQDGMTSTSYGADSIDNISDTKVDTKPPSPMKVSSLISQISDSLEIKEHSDETLSFQESAKIKATARKDSLQVVTKVAAAHDSKPKDSSGSVTTEDTIVHEINEVFDTKEILGKDSEATTTHREEVTTDDLNVRTVSPDKGSTPLKESIQVIHDSDESLAKEPKDSSKTISSADEILKKPLQEELATPVQSEKSSETDSAIPEEKIIDLESEIGAKTESLKDDKKETLKDETPIMPVSTELGMTTSLAKDSSQVSMTTDLVQNQAEGSKDFSQIASPSIQQKTITESSPDKLETPEQSQKSSRIGSPTTTQTVTNEVSEMSARKESFKSDPKSLILQTEDSAAIEQLGETIESQISPTIESAARKDSFHVATDDDSKILSRSASPAIVEECDEKLLQDKSTSKELAPEELITENVSNTIVDKKSSKVDIQDAPNMAESLDKREILDDYSTKRSSISEITKARKDSLKVASDIDEPHAQNSEVNLSANRDEEISVSKDHSKIDTDVDTTCSQESNDFSRSFSPKIQKETVEEYLEDKSTTPYQSPKSSKDSWDKPAETEESQKSSITEHPSMIPKYNDEVLTKESSMYKSNTEGLGQISDILQSNVSSESATPATEGSTVLQTNDHDVDDNVNDIKTGGLVLAGTQAEAEVISEKSVEKELAPALEYLDKDKYISTSAIKHGDQPNKESYESNITDKPSCPVSIETSDTSFDQGLTSPPLADDNDSISPKIDILNRSTITEVKSASEDDLEKSPQIYDFVKDSELIGNQETSELLKSEVAEQSPQSEHIVSIEASLQLDIESGTKDEIDASDKASINQNQPYHEVDDAGQTRDIPPPESKAGSTGIVQVPDEALKLYTKETVIEDQLPQLDKEKLGVVSQSIDTVDHESISVSLAISETKQANELQTNKIEQSSEKNESSNIALSTQSHFANSRSELSDHIEKMTYSSYGEASHKYDTESSTKEFKYSKISDEKDANIIREEAESASDIDLSKGQETTQKSADMLETTNIETTTTKTTFDHGLAKPTNVAFESSKTSTSESTISSQIKEENEEASERIKHGAAIIDDVVFNIKEKRDITEPTQTIEEFTILQQTESPDNLGESSDFVKPVDPNIKSEVKPSNGHIPVELDTTVVCKEDMKDDIHEVNKSQSFSNESTDSSRTIESSSHSTMVCEIVKESEQITSERLSDHMQISSSLASVHTDSGHKVESSEEKEIDIQTSNQAFDTPFKTSEKKAANGYVQQEETEQEESMSYISMKSDLDSYDSMSLQDHDLARALKDEQLDTLAVTSELSHKMYSEETDLMQKSFVSIFESTLKEDPETLASSSEDISKEISCEEKHSFEFLEKESKKHSQTHEAFTCSAMKTEIDSSLRESICTRTAHAESGSPKDVSLSMTTDSGIMSLQADNKLGPFEGTDYTQTLKDNAMNLMESVSKAFIEDSVQQGIKTESVDSLLVRSEFERVSTPPTVPVSPLPKTPSSTQDLKVTDGIQSELTYDKSEGAEETITKVVHVGDDILTQKISTSTEKVSKPVKVATETDDSDLSSLMHSMGKMKTETDTVTKIIKEGVNVVTQTITTVTTKEIISREDGTPQNVKTTIETTTLSKGSDGSTTTTRDTQTLLSECSSSLKSTSQMDLYAKDIKLDKEYLDTSDDKSESLSSQTSEKESSLKSDFTNSQMKKEQALPLRSEFITTVDDDSDENIEDTVIDTDVSKKIIKEGGLDIVETVITTTRKELLKLDNTKKILRTTTETNITKERPDGSKDTQKNVDVRTEEIKSETKSPKEETPQGITSNDALVQSRKSSITQINSNLGSTDMQGFENSLNRKHSLSSVKDTRVEVKEESVANDVPVEQVLEGFTKLEGQTVNVETQEKSVLRDGVLINQKITITTTKEILVSDDGSKKKLKTTIETVTESKLPNGTTEVVKDAKILIADYGIEIVGENLEGFDCVGEPDEQTTSLIEEIIENNIKINRKTTVTTIRQEFENNISKIRKNKTMVRTVIEDEHPNGTIFTKKSEKTSIADVFLKTPQSECGELQISDAYTDLSEVVEDVSEDTDVKSETVQRENQTIIRTVTTKTKRETLNSSNATVKRIRTTIETNTVDEYPSGATETTKDVKITVSETQTTSDSNLQSALAGLHSTGKIKTSVDKKHNSVVLNGEEMTQTITTKITKEELICTDTDEVAVKTVTETITETAKKDGSVETARDVQTQITYLPHGATLDDLTEEHLDVIEKQPIFDQTPQELPFKEKNTLPILKQRSPNEEAMSNTEVSTKNINENGIDIEQTITVVTTKELISPDKVKTTIETTTVNKGSDGVTKTLKATKTTFSELEEKYGTGESEKSFSKTDDLRSSSAASDDLAHGFGSPPSDLSSRESKATHAWGTESSGLYYSDEDGPGSPSSTKSQIAHSPRSNLSFELEPSKNLAMETSFYKDPMSTSVYAQLPEESHHEVKTEKTITKLTHEFLTHEKLRAEENIQDVQVSDSSFLTEADEHFDKAIEEHKKVSGSEVISNITAKYDLDLVQSTSHEENKSEESQIILQDIISDGKKVTEIATSSTSKEDTKTEKSEISTESTTMITSKDPIESWGKPLGLPSPIMPPTQSDGKSTPKKQNPMLNKNKLNQEKIKEARKSSESPSKKKPPAPVYLELTYVPHHGNSYYSAVEFFKRVRARYYVFSGTEPSKEIYNALLDAKKTWEDKDLEVTIIPTYDTDVLGYWVTENEDALEKYKIDLSPSASRCTINLQDHETSCAAYRLEF